MSVVFVQLRKQVSTWRVRWPAEALRGAGHDARAYSFGAATAGAVERTDDVVLHVTSELGTELIDAARVFKAHARRLILNVDDNWLALSNIQAMNAHAAEFRTQFIEVLRLADLVICSTPALELALAGYTLSTACVPNYLPKRYFSIRSPRPRARLAWMGQMGVHRRDWELIVRPHVHKLPPLLLVGSGVKGAHLLRTWGARDVRATEPTDNVEVLYRQMSSARAAIVPLVDDEFNRAKSWNKPMEFAALGVPSACSMHEEYVRLSRAGAPVYCAPDAPALVRLACQLYDTPPGGFLSPSMSLELAGVPCWEFALGLDPHDVTSRTGPPRRSVSA